MPSTYSPNLRIELIASGEQANTWGTTTNNNLGTLIGEAIAGLVDVSVTASDVVLTELDGLSDQSRQMMITISGAPGTPRTVSCPDGNTKVYVVANDSDDVVTFTTVSGSGVDVPVGTSKFVYCDGVDVYEAVTAVDTLLLGGAPTTSLEAVNKGYVDTALSTKAPATSGTSILYGNGAGGFSSVTVGSGLSFTGGTLSNSSTSPIPSGTRMLFVQSAAPTGWTQITSYNNYALRVVSGTGGGTGGSVGFTSAFASQAVSGTVGATTLSLSQIPSHTHSIVAGSNGLGVAGSGSDDGNYTFTDTLNNTVAQFSAAAAGGSGSHTHSFTGTAINMAVQYVDTIICSKD